MQRNMDSPLCVLFVAMVSTSTSILLPTSPIMLVSRHLLENVITDLTVDNKAVGIMKAGHVFTIEPMICEGTWRDQLW